jgi:hypothetical protein
MLRVGTHLVSIFGLDLASLYYVAVFCIQVVGGSALSKQLAVITKEVCDDN